ncbi:MAG: sulfur relay protein DsrC [Proteobacteria bacterium]|nr:sulfur relay protein DsrC [Pseudomonadota bacterium]
MMKVSDLIIQHPEVRSFEELKGLVVATAKSGYRFLQFDVKPEFIDTPRNWDLVLEAVFYHGARPRS